MGLGLSGLRLGLGQQLWGTVWSPANLFPTGTEEGLFLDFSDISTLYTDQTFATNISAIGDPVGGVLDKSGNGNHLIQATAAARPIWTRHPKSGVRNLLDASEDLTGWTMIRCAIALSGASAAPTGENSYKLTPTAVTNSTFAYGLWPVAPDPTKTYSVSVYAKAGGYGVLQIAGSNGFAGSNTYFQNFDLTNGVAGTGNGFVYAFEAVGGGWYRCSCSALGNNTFSELRLLAAVVPSASSGRLASGTWNGSDGVILASAQIEEGATATAYQSRVSKYDVTEAGVADCYGLTFDGVDDYMVTAANLDLSGDDQVFACMGADMTDVATTAWALDTYTAVSTPSFTIKAPMSDGVSSVNTTSSGNGARVATAGQSVSAPFVLSAWSDISAPSVIDRLDGTSGTAVTTSQGTGNQSSGTLTLAARNSDKTLTFTGTIYGVTLTDYILDAEQLAALETWTAARTPEVTLA